MGSDDEFDQLVFRDGQLVNRDNTVSETSNSEPIIPNEDSGFTLETIDHVLTHLQDTGYDPDPEEAHTGPNPE